LFALTILIVYQIDAQSNNNNERVFCPSLPDNIAEQFWFLPNNPYTKNCSLCTQYTYCSWCDQGMATNIKILGVTIDNIVLDGFCWTGNPFGLLNNTFYINSSMATGFDVVCNDPPRWRQCAVSGTVAIALVFGGIGLVIFGTCCTVFCCCCCCRSRKHRYLRIK